MLNEHFVVAVRARLWVRVQATILTPCGGWRSPDLLVIAPRGRRAHRGYRVARRRGREQLARSRCRESRGVRHAGVPEYWIVDVDRDEVLVHREPVDGAYASVARFTPGDTIEPLIDVPPVDVAALLAR